MEKLINARESTRILGCSLDHVLDWRRTGKTKGFRHNARHRRFRKVDIDKLAKKRASPSSEMTEAEEMVAVTRQACAY